MFESAADAVVAGDAAALARMLGENSELVRERSARDHRSLLLHYVSANGVEDFRQKTPPNIVEIARMLLDAGADVNAESKAYGGGSTALGLTATSIHPEKAGLQIGLMELLLARGARIDKGMVNACLANGRGRAAEFLASRGAHLDLEGAAGVGRLDLVQEFFDAAAKQITDGLGWACEYARLDIVRFLLDKNLSREALDRGLHWAAYAGEPEIVKMLLDRGAPAGEKDERFHATPLGWAMHARNSGRPGRFSEVIELLIAAGAAPITPSSPK
ncbi:MAG TPA: ankyrin repeat domain-containing protein [Bryobacteraceae bacterium]|nr:ankyrin repeat domain-containing protein [Bryobacteraceae bacterium]